MALPDLILQPFANAGDKTPPPQTDPLGFVNFSQGYTQDYEINLASGNTLAKAVERQVQNYMFNQSTAAIQAWQQNSYAPWYGTMTIGGVAGYPIGAFVSTTTSGGVTQVWRSLVANNVANPTAPGQTSWEYVPSNMERLSQVPMPAGGVAQSVPGGQTAELITVATDFNTFTTGTWEFQTDAIANSSPNAPGAAATLAGMLEAKQWKGTGTNTANSQTYRDRSGNVFTRGAANGAWTPWLPSTFAYTPADDSKVVHIAGAETITGAKTFNNNVNITTPGQNGLMMVSPSSNSSSVGFNNTSSNRIWTIGTAGSAGVNYAPPASFFILDNNSSASRITIDTNGGVGLLGAYGYFGTPDSVSNLATAPGSWTSAKAYGLWLAQNAEYSSGGWKAQNTTNTPCTIGFGTNGVLRHMAAAVPTAVGNAVTWTPAVDIFPGGDIYSYGMGSGGQYRMCNGQSGSSVFWRFDGASVYLLKSTTYNGTFDATRPFSWNISGGISSDQNWTIGGSVTFNGVLQSSTTTSILAAANGGQIYLRPNGSGSATGQTTIAANGGLNVNTTAGGGGFIGIGINDPAQPQIALIGGGAGNGPANKYIRALSGNLDIINGSYGYVMASFHDYGSASAIIVNSAIYPTSDNIGSCGASGARWQTVWAVNGTIQTSDAREKTPLTPMSAAELNAAKQLADLIGTYQWLRSIEEKGADKARHHVGVTAQAAIEIMKANGLDPFSYGFICYDEWDEIRNPNITEQRDEEGNITREAVDNVTPAGNRYSMRYDELNLFIAQGMNQRLKAIEAKLGL